MQLRRQRESLVVQTPAKLNLFLEILGKRADGYHEIETLMVSVGLHDTLTFSPTAGRAVYLRCFQTQSVGRAGQSLHQDVVDAAAPVPTGSDNLVVRAAELLSRETGVRQGVRIDLVKRIPIAAGLAGGSSDAAATLAGLNRLWNLHLPAERLMAYAAELGSDVGFFFCGQRAAICRGRGERIEPLAVSPALHFVVVCPAEGLSTAAVYEQCRPAERVRSVAPLREALGSGRRGRVAETMYNALERPAAERYSKIGQLRKRFSKLSVPGHQMSGSGSAYFGLCTHRRQAQSVAARLRAERWGRVFVVQCRF